MRRSPTSSSLASWAMLLYLLSAVFAASAHSIVGFPQGSSPAVDSLLPEHHQFGPGPAVELRMIDVDPRPPANLERRTAASDTSESSSCSTSTISTPPKKNTKPTSAPASTTLPSVLSTASSTGPVKTSILVATPTASIGPLPTAFDTSRSDNTTSACSKFFDTFLSNSTFTSCVPVSLLLKTSSSFFTNTKSFAIITRTLDAACNAPVDKCTALLSSYAEMVGKDDVCGQDLKNGNPLVVAAKTGFLAYKTMHDATCLKNPDTDNYCFAEAVSDPDMLPNVYIYHLGLGTSLTGGRPKCGKCLAATMQVFWKSSGDKKQPVSEVYGSASQQVNIACGPNFVSTSTPSSGIRLSSHLPLTSLILALSSTVLFLIFT